MKVIVVGAGHNGLVGAFYLARQGADVTVLEQKSRAGGACINETLECGCRISTGANHFGMLHDKIRNDLRWLDDAKGIIVPDPQAVVFLGHGESIALYRNRERLKAELARFSFEDSQRLDAYLDDLQLAVSVLSEFTFLEAPAEGELFESLDKKRRGLGTRFLTNSALETLGEYFSHPAVIVAFLAGTILYKASPAEAGTAFSLLYLGQYSVRGEPGWGFVPGGMGKVTEHILQQATESGARIFLNAKVDEIIVRAGYARGVRYNSDRTLEADFVISCTDPVTTYTKLLSSGHTFRDVPMEGCVSKLNFILDRPVLPKLVDPIRAQEAIRTLSVICPSPRYLQTAYQDCRAGKPSSNPYVEIVFPSNSDATSSCGIHSVGSAFILYTPAKLTSGGWPEIEPQYSASVISLLERYFEGIANHLSWFEFLSPSGLESRLGLLCGNVDHGDLRPGNRLRDRIHHRYPDGKYLVENLLVCGAGSYPGGLVSGVPGYRAAEEVLSAIEFSKLRSYK